MVNVTESDVALGDGRVLHVYDARTEGAGVGLPVVWHHATPNVGEPPEPLFPAATEVGVRWVSYDRPGYGGSTPHPGRDLASTASDVAAVADALGVDRFAVMGVSGGGSHALACAALLPGRVVGAVSVAGLAPYGAEGLDWFAGMAAASEAELRASVRGRAALTERLNSAGFDPEVFTPADHAALEGDWAWMGEVAGKGAQTGFEGTVDDNLAYVGAWGFDPSRISAPVLLLHGARDRVVPQAHGEWLARHCPSAEWWLRPEDGHLSVLHSAPHALRWLRERGW